jgi:tight adherence protein C
MNGIEGLLADILGSSSAVYETGFFLVVFVTAVLVVVGIASMKRSDRLAQRLQGTNGTVSNAGRVSVRYGGGDDGVKRLLAPFLRAVPLDDEKLSAARRHLVQAGYYDPNAVRIFYAVRIAVAVIATPLVLLFVSLVFKNLNTLQMTAVGLVTASAGLYLPMLIVRSRIRHRQRDIREGLPDALDLMLVCVEAGLSLDAAINRVAGEIARSSPILSEQFRLVALEFQAGKGRAEALRHLAARTAVDDVKSFVTLLVHSDRLGTSMAQSLRVHASEMRVKRLMRAEERANKLPVKLAMPLGGFYLPCLLIVIFTPLIIRMARILG